ncbi:hypothetical protein QJS83_08315 [Bdellovibrio sp. 22V]|uniref:hypothetical protein n=1 Tax=Bdellovibrio sp. 22V TaxID=3044166 RepID=UPI0025435B07|nr:hypothetical protein [Bdellovibrio sp. 22V]WII73880.1 hypothetical protein QJS83_08315 [Bdellovibrio sp. 22V]
MANSQIQIANMPRVRSQDSIGLCYAFVAATLFDEANCAAKKTMDCASVPDQEKVSPLDMARFSKNLPENADITDRYNYEGLDIGGSEQMALYNAINSRYLVKESCAPFDQVANKVPDAVEAQKLELAMWTKLENSFKAYKKKVKECAGCGLEYATAKADQFKKEYKLKASNEEILEAFAQDTYGNFLDRLLIPDDCLDLKNQFALQGDWDIETFPERNKKGTYDSMISKIKEVLGQKRPLALGFCAQEPLKVKSNEACGEFGHALVIKGYRKVCNQKNQCRDVLQVQNSWGESWQRANDDGWVDAKELLKRTFYASQSLSWLKQKQ